MLFTLIFLIIIVIITIIYNLSVNTINNTDKFQSLSRQKTNIDEILKNANGKLVTGSDLVTFAIMKLNPVVFGLPGATVWPIFESMSSYQSLIQYTPVKHESIAVFAGEGYGAMRQCMGMPAAAFVLATSGPGIVNTFPGIYDATYDFYPVIIITANIASRELENKLFHAFQKFDVNKSNQLIAKKVYAIENVNQITSTVVEAYKQSLESERVPAGAIVVEIPHNFLLEKMIFNYNTFINSLNLSISQEFEELISKSKYSHIASLIQSSKRPFVVIGRGIIKSRIIVWRFVEKYSLPFGYTLKGKGLLPDDHPQCYGYIGLHGLKTPNRALYESDLVLLLGCLGDEHALPNINKFTNGLSIVFDWNPITYKGRKMERVIYVTEDIGKSIPFLAKNLKLDTKWYQWHTHLKNLQNSEITNLEITNLSMPKHLNPIKVYKHINDLAKNIDTLVLDVGTNQQESARYIKLRANIYNNNKSVLYAKTPEWQKQKYHKQVITSGSAGTMGTAIAYSLGAYLAKGPYPNKILTIVGDGAFEMHLTSLWLLAYHKNPFTIVLINDGVYNELESLAKTKKEQKYIQNTLPDSNIPKLGKSAADMYGLQYTKIDTEETLYSLNNIQNQGIIEAIVYPLKRY